MTPDRSLRPADAAAALRSFPRRFRAVFAPADGPDDDFDPDEIGRRVGPDGSSAADHLIAADGIVALLERAVEQIVGDDDASLHPAIADLGSAPFEEDHTPVPALLDQFGANALRAADRIDGVGTEDWTATGRIADREDTVDALTVTQDAVDAAATHLRAAQRAMDAVV
ncbi:MAG: hypothetical protein ACSLFO_07600 [Acidimicrobiales bacterium]